MTIPAHIPAVQALAVPEGPRGHPGCIAVLCLCPLSQAAGDPRPSCAVLGNRVWRLHGGR